MNNEICVCFHCALLVRIRASVVTYRSRWQYWTRIRLDSRSKLDVFLVESSLVICVNDCDDDGWLEQVLSFFVGFTKNNRLSKSKKLSKKHMKMQINQKKKFLLSKKISANQKIKSFFFWCCER